MKNFYTILILIIFSSTIQAQFQVDNGTQVSISDGDFLYSKSNVINEGTIQFLGATPTGDLYLDGGLDNSTGTLTLGDAILHIGSGNTVASGPSNSAGDYDFIFNSNDDAAKFVEFNKVGGTITVDNAAGGLLNITNTLTSFGAGTLTSNDKVVLKSTTIANTAIVPESYGGTINGIRVERFIPNERAYRMMASPVDTDVASNVAAKTSIFQNWQQGGLYPSDPGYLPEVGTHITGLGWQTPFIVDTSANGFDINGSGDPSMWVYNYITLTWDALIETSTDANLNNTVTRGLNTSEAYYMLIRGDRSVDLQWNAVPSTQTVLHQTGSLKIGQEAKPVGALLADEFVAIANPYQAPVDMSLVIPTVATNFKHQLWAWEQTDINSGQFVHISDLSNPINSLPGSNQNEFIQPGQSVFIQAETTGIHTVTFEESFKGGLNALEDVFKSNEPNQVEGFIRLGLYNKSHKAFKDLAYDGLIILFDKASDDNVNNDDGMKIFNHNENMAIEVDNSLLTFNKRKLPVNLDEVIDISLYNLNKKEYKFSIDYKGLNSLPNGVMLWDKYTDTYTPLEDKQVIEFSVDSNIPETKDEKRFALVFENSTLGFESATNYSLNVYPNPVTSDFINIQFSKANNSDVTVELFDLLGKRVLSKEYTNVERSIKLDNLDIATGVYLLNVKQNNQVNTFKIIKE